MEFYADIIKEHLDGKFIKSITQTDKELIFNTTECSIWFFAEGDCCSGSYIESLDNPEIFIDANFIDVEVVDGEQKEGEDEYTIHKWKFYKFKTNKGMCTLSFRNDSNGYYDGRLEYSGTKH